VDFRVGHSTARPTVQVARCVGVWWMGQPGSWWVGWTARPRPHVEGAAPWMLIGGPGCKLMFPDASARGKGAAYIALRNRHVPFDETDLTSGLD
jgi:hypothetical protein